MSLVSIITASYNSEKTIAATFDSIVRQIPKPVQYIVIDGASKDNTVNIIKEYRKLFEENQIDFIWISEPDKGIYDAWNKGLARSSGQWISFLGSDDILLPGALETMARLAKADPEADFIAAKARILSADGTSRIFGEPWSWKVFRREMKILHAGAWHNANYFKRYGIFDDSFKIVGDYEMLLRAGKDLKVNYFDQIVVEMGGEGVSSTRIHESLAEARRAKLQNGARNAFQAIVDQYWVYFKIKLKHFVR